MVLGTAIYCTRVDEMSDVVALPKPKFTSRRAHDGFRQAADGGFADPPRVVQGVGLRGVAASREAA